MTRLPAASIAPSAVTTDASEARHPITDLRVRQLHYKPHGNWAMPSARAADASHSSLLRVSTIGGIAIAVFALSWFVAALVSAAGQL